MADGRVVIDVDLNSNQAEKLLRQLKGKLEETGRSSEKAFPPLEEGADRASRSIDGARGSLVGLITKLGAMMGFTDLVSRAVGRVDTIDTATKSLTVLTGSADVAKGVMNDLSDAIQGTPIALDQVALGAKKMVAAGMEGSKVKGVFTAIADAAYGVGNGSESIDQMTDAIASLQASSIAYSDDINRLVDAGVPAWQILANQTGKSVGEIKDDVSKGMLDSNTAIQMLVDGIENGTDGVAGHTAQMAGLAKTAGDTISGSFANAATAAVKALANIVTGLKGDIIGALQYAQEAFKKFGAFTSSETFQAGLRAFVETIKHLVSILPTLIPIISAVIAAFGTVKAISSITTIIGSVTKGIGEFTLLLKGSGGLLGGLIKGLDGLKLAFKGLFSALSANPIILIVAGIAALAAALVVAYNKSETFRNAVNAMFSQIVSLFEPLKPVFESLKQAFKQLCDALRPLVEDLLKAAAPIVEALVGVLGALLSVALVPIIAALQGLMQVIQFLMPVIQAILSVVIVVFTGILEFIGGVINGLVDFFTVVLPGAIQSVIDWFAKLPENIAAFFTMAADTIYGWGESIAAFFLETIPGWIASIGEWFAQLPYAIGYALGYALATIGEWGLNVWNFFTETIPNWIASIGQWFSELPGRIGQWLTQTITDLGSWASQMLENMRNGAMNAINGVIEWFQQLPGRISEWLQNAIQSVIHFASDLGHQATQAGRGLVDNIINAVASLPGKMLEIGRNIVRGVYDGIMGMGKWLKDQVFGFFSGIVDGAKAALGINSPSRVMRDMIGRNMALGVSVGWEKEMPDLKKTVSADMTGLSARMQAAVQAEVSATGAGMGAGIVNNITNVQNRGGESPESMDVNLTVESPPIYLDSDIIADKTTSRVVKNVTRDKTAKNIAKGRKPVYG